MHFQDMLDAVISGRKNVQPLNFSPDETFHIGSDIEEPVWTLLDGVIIAACGAVFGLSLVSLIGIIMEVL